WQGSHREKCSLPKKFFPSSSTQGFRSHLCNSLSLGVSNPATTTGTTGGLPGASNGRRMLKGMPGLHNTTSGGAFGRLARFGILKGLRSIEIDREEFRRQL